jgi:hypothetical protein
MQAGPAKAAALRAILAATPRVKPPAARVVLLDDIRPPRAPPPASPAPSATTQRRLARPAATLAQLATSPKTPACLPARRAAAAPTQQGSPMCSAPTAAVGGTAGVPLQSVSCAQVGDTRQPHRPAARLVLQGLMPRLQERRNAWTAVRANTRLGWATLPATCAPSAGPPQQQAASSAAAPVWRAPTPPPAGRELAPLAQLALMRVAPKTRRVR